MILKTHVSEYNVLHFFMHFYRFGVNTFATGPYRQPIATLAINLTRTSSWLIYCPISISFHIKIQKKSHKKDLSLSLSAFLNSTECSFLSSVYLLSFSQFEHSYQDTLLSILLNTIFWFYSQNLLTTFEFS